MLNEKAQEDLSIDVAEWRPREWDTVVSRSLEGVNNTFNELSKVCMTRKK